MDKDIISQLRASALEAVKKAKNLKSLEDIRVKFLGRKDGELTKILRSLKNLSVEAKRALGPLANALREDLEAALAKKLNDFQVSSSIVSHVSSLCKNETISLFTSRNFFLINLFF